MCPDIEAYAPLIAAAFGLGEAVGRRPSRPPAAGAPRRPRAHPDQPAARRRRQAARPRRWPHRGQRGARPVAAEPVRRRFGFSEDDLETLDQLGGAGRRPLGLRRRSTARRTASTATSRTPGASASTACSPAWRCPTTPTAGSAPRCRSTTSAAPASTSPAASPSASTGCSTSPTGWSAATRSSTGWTRCATPSTEPHRRRARRRVAAGQVQRELAASPRTPRDRRRARAAPARRARAAAPSGSPVGRPGPTSAPAR